MIYNTKQFIIELDDHLKLFILLVYNLFFLVFL